MVEREEVERGWRRVGGPSGKGEGGVGGDGKVDGRGRLRRGRR